MGQLSERDHCSTEVCSYAAWCRQLNDSKETAGDTHLAHTACEHALRVHDTDKAYCLMTVSMEHTADTYL